VVSVARGVADATRTYRLSEEMVADPSGEQQWMNERNAEGGYVSADVAETGHIE